MTLMNHRTTSSATVNTLCTSTSYGVGPVLPPTYNHLDAAQRARLIKSSRKLGKVLGTTPVVAEYLPPLPDSSPSSSMTNVARKRCSAPPTPNSAYTEFIMGTSPGSGSGSRIRTVSDASGTSEKDKDSQPNSSHIFLAEPDTASVLQHRKASSEAPVSLPVYPSSDAARHKSKRSQQHQPVLRLAPANGIRNVDEPSSGPDSLLSPFPPDYKLNAVRETANLTTSVPRSPTSSGSSLSTDMPQTPRSAPSDSHPSLLDDVFAYPGANSTSNPVCDETRLRKRRMEKLMRHLGECVPSELVLGSSRTREAASISGYPLPPLPIDSPTAGTSKMRDAQARVMRRVSVISGHRRRANAEDNDHTSLGCISEPESGSNARILAVLSRERTKPQLPRDEKREKEKDKVQHLVEDDWTPEAYEDIVKRLRRLK